MSVTSWPTSAANSTDQPASASMAAPLGAQPGPVFGGGELVGVGEPDAGVVAGAGVLFFAEGEQEAEAGVLGEAAQADLLEGGDGGELAGEVAADREGRPSVPVMVKLLPEGPPSGNRWPP